MRSERREEECWVESEGPYPLACPADLTPHLLLASPSLINSGRVFSLAVYQVTNVTLTSSHCEYEGPQGLGGGLVQPIGPRARRPSQRTARARGASGESTRLTDTLCESPSTESTRWQFSVIFHGILGRYLLKSRKPSRPEQARVPPLPSQPTLSRHVTQPLLV